MKLTLIQEANIEFGIAPDEPASSFYGARAIVNNNKSFDIPWDRTTYKGTDDKAFTDWIDNVAFPYLKVDMSKNYCSDYKGNICSGDGKYFMKWDTKSSGGYLYIGAWAKEPILFDPVNTMANNDTKTMLILNFGTGESTCPYWMVPIIINGHFDYGSLVDSFTSFCEANSEDLGYEEIVEIVMNNSGLSWNMIDGKFEANSVEQIYI